MAMLSADEQVARCERNLRQFEDERARLQWILRLSAAAPWLPGFIWGWRIGLFVFVSVLLFYFVGRYINFFHVREAKQLLQNARDRVVPPTS
jgi:hypothetical protein